MITATEIRICMDTGRVVTLHREGKQWTLPALTDRRRTWFVVDRLWPGDRLVLPDCRPGVLIRGLVGFAAAMCVTWAVATCPACAASAAHHIDIPDDNYEGLSWAVIRTCITCDHSWLQEGALTGRPFTARFPSRCAHGDEIREGDTVVPRRGPGAR